MRCRRVAPGLVKEECMLRSAPVSASPLDEEEVGVRPAQGRVSIAALVEVECERCGRSASVQPGSGDVIVTCAKCKARFWVDTDELLQRQ